MSGDEELRENIIEAEVVGETERFLGEPPPPMSSAVVRRERSSEVLRPLDVDQVVASFEEYQRLLSRILTDRDWQGLAGAEGSFVKKRGWRKIAAAFDLDVKILGSAVARDDDGKPVRAEATAVAISPKGRTMEGDGYCDVGEPRFRAAAGRSKLENDLRKTATTRAKNSAISDLVGMGDVSAEEASDDRPEDGRFAYGPKASDAQVTQTRNAIKYMIGSPDDEEVDQILELVRKSAQTEQMAYLPLIALRAICLTATVFKERSERTATPQGDPSQESAEEREERERAERIAAGQGVLNRID